MTEPTPPKTQQPHDDIHDIAAQSISLMLPPAIVKRLDDVLIPALRDAGHGRISRPQLIGAIILATAPDPAQLYETLRSYRTATVADAVPTNDATVIAFPARPTGRPRRS
ncbi:MAG: hypothetical protein ACR2KV_02565 [Solirubrobacteraceae bacterium]